MWFAFYKFATHKHTTGLIHTIFVHETHSHAHSSLFRPFLLSLRSKPHSSRFCIYTHTFNRHRTLKITWVRVGTCVGVYGERRWRGGLGVGCKIHPLYLNVCTHDAHTGLLLLRAPYDWVWPRSGSWVHRAHGRTARSNEQERDGVCTLQAGALQGLQVSPCYSYGLIWTRIQCIAIHLKDIVREWERQVVWKGRRPTRAAVWPWYGYGLIWMRISCIVIELKDIARELERELVRKGQRPTRAARFIVLNGMVLG